MEFLCKVFTCRSRISPHSDFSKPYFLTIVGVLIAALVSDVWNTAWRDSRTISVFWKLDVWPWFALWHLSTLSWLEITSSIARDQWMSNMFAAMISKYCVDLAQRIKFAGNSSQSVAHTWKWVYFSCLKLFGVTQTQNFTIFRFRIRSKFHWNWGWNLDGNNFRNGNRKHAIVVHSYRLQITLVYLNVCISFFL